jgi:hypothetical protein
VELLVQREVGTIQRSIRGVAIFAAAALIALVPSYPAQAACGWHRVPAPLGPGFTTVPFGIDARNADDAWAVGWYISHGVVTDEPVVRPFFMHWNGTSWKVVKAAHQLGAKHDFLTGVTIVSKDDVWAVGTYENATTHQSGTEIQHWNGSRWSIVRSPTPSGATSSVLESVDAIAADDIWATGSVSNGSDFSPLIEHWNGTRWRVVSHPFTSTTQTLRDVARIPGSTRAWVVGTSGDATLTGRSTGTTWAEVDAPEVDSMSHTLEGVSASSPKDAWAVGSHGTQTLAEHWTGSAWSIVPAPNAGTGSSSLAAVADFSPTRALALGAKDQNGIGRILAIRWNGTEWKVVPFPAVGVADNAVLDMAAIPGTNGAWAAAIYLDGEDVAKPFFERYC